MPTRPFKKPISVTEAFTAIAKAQQGIPMPEQVAWTLRLLVMQFFRSPSETGDFADKELSMLYCGDHPTEEDEPDFEPEVVRVPQQDCLALGPCYSRSEDFSPPEVHCTLLTEEYLSSTVRKPYTVKVTPSSDSGVPTALPCGD